ncbi:RidA family protein [Ferviditalea candida]|uniref:RidA family protein n=1 Tax=Ferviditalea candida TaxID=3108399 RepID=A0ABU5ZHX1_9BACL|nr:RidA family protein [Paenibacillaceae bacterium T2]
MTRNHNRSAITESKARGGWLSETAAPSKPAGHYEPAVLSGNLLYISGVTPKRDGILLYRGKVGRDLTAEEAYQAARLCGQIILAQIQASIGSLDRIEQMVKLTGYVACEDTFTQHPFVINGASDILLDVLGERGKHARCALGVVSLPGGAAVEVEALVRLCE